VDTYAEVKQAGRYKECERTAGVSTTVIFLVDFISIKTWI
jgi:hypothetical protein